ncbi:MAG: hypothetical protein IJ088_07245 [Clostridia bacterium]|nr:hypothetical protein [Clostridia bacterium]
MNVTIIPLVHDYKGRILREDCMEIARKILEPWNLEMVTGFSPMYGAVQYSVHNVHEKKNSNPKYNTNIEFIICTDKKRKIVYDTFSEYCPVFEEDFDFNTDRLYDQNDYDELEKKWVTLLDAITLPEKG